MITLSTTDSDTEKLLKGSILYESEKSAHRKTDFKLQTAVLHLTKSLQTFEGKWDSDERCDSVEEAMDYIDAAKFLQKYFNRTHNRIDKVQAWVDGYVPWEQK